MSRRVQSFALSAASLVIQSVLSMLRQLATCALSSFSTRSMLRRETRPVFTTILRNLRTTSTRRVQCQTSPTLLILHAQVSTYHRLPQPRFPPLSILPPPLNCHSRNAEGRCLRNHLCHRLLQLQLLPRRQSVCFVAEVKNDHLPSRATARMLPAFGVQAQAMHRIVLDESPSCPPTVQLTQLDQK